MHRTTIMISPELKRKASELARRRALSLGEFTRRALETAVRQDKTGCGRDDSLLADCTVFKGKTPRDLSLRHDSYLYEE